MDRVFGITLDYLRTREQFGRKIGSFQALQRRSADLKIQVALARATVEAAARSRVQAMRLCAWAPCSGPKHGRPMRPVP
jgi:alkylation response protein AidB-like acyl-CoA dehydrogenase